MAENIAAAEAESDHNRVRIFPQEEHGGDEGKGLGFNDKQMSATHQLRVLHVHVIEGR